MDPGLKILGGLATDEIDLTGRSVTAIEIALRPLQHFDAFDVEQHATTHHRVWNVDLIDIEADRRRSAGTEVLKADAAQRIDGYAGRRHVVDREAGRRLGELICACDAEIAQPSGADDTHRDADVIGTLFVLLRRDDDLFEHRAPAAWSAESATCAAPMHRIDVMARLSAPPLIVVIPQPFLEMLEAE